MNEQIVVETIVHAPVEKVWRCYTEPEHITQWAFASDDWCAPRAENDVRTGGRFLTRMESKDGAHGFDFTGVYDEVVPMEKIAYTMDGADARKAIVAFAQEGSDTKVSVTFDPENENPIELQRSGWQAILDNFKKHVEVA